MKHSTFRKESLWLTRGYDKLVELVAQSHISEETAEITAIDAEEDDVIIYLNSAFRTAKSSPVAAKRKAGTAVYNAAKPYIGIQRLPQRQQVQKVVGLLNDLAKADLDAHIALGLTEEVENLATVNARYQALLESRANSQIANIMEDFKTVRAEMDTQHNEMVTTAFAFSITTPSFACYTLLIKVIEYLFLLVC